jgi:hypothetical protein
VGGALPDQVAHWEDPQSSLPDSVRVILKLLVDTFTALEAQIAVLGAMPFACCSSVLTGTKRMLGRWAASQIASASVASFFCRLMNGLTHRRTYPQ